MTIAVVDESIVERATLAWFESMGYVVSSGQSLTTQGPDAERGDYTHVVLERRLRQALVRLNPDLPAEALEDAFRKLTRTDAPSLVERNRAVHRMLVDGVRVEGRRPDLPAQRAAAQAHFRRAAGEAS